MLYVAKIPPFTDDEAFLFEDALISAKDWIGDTAPECGDKRRLEGSM